MKKSIKYMLGALIACAAINASATIVQYGDYTNPDTDLTPDIRISWKAAYQTPTASGVACAWGG